MIVANEKLQRARLERRWSVAAASRRVGVSANTFNRWERGLQIPQLATLDQLCAAFAMSAEDLGFGQVVTPPKKADGDSYPSEDAHEMALTPLQQAPLSGIASRPVVVTSLIRLQPVVAGDQAEGEQAPAEANARTMAIAALISSPVQIFNAVQGGSLLLRGEEIVALCTAYIPLCWQLHFEGGMAIVEQILPGYIAQLTQLIPTSPLLQKQVAVQLSQIYQLASLVATQHQDYGRACSCAQQALFYGKLAENPHLQAASFIRCALVYFYLKRDHLRLRAYQQALELAPQISPLLQGRICIGLAEVHSKLGQEDQARHFLDLARATFPLTAEDDPCYPWTHFSLTSLSTFEGLMYLNLGQPAQARETFERIDRSVSRNAVPNRLGLLVHQAFTFCALGEMDQTCALIERTLPMARALGSQLCADQAYEVYEKMLTKWGHEQRVMNLEELFH